MRTALIIGASGQDGRLLARLLLQRGYAVCGWTRTEPVDLMPCQCAIVNILQPASVEKGLEALRPDEIYYLAAFHHSTEDLLGGGTAKLLRRSFDVHVLGLLNVLRVLKPICPRARLFYAGSSHVFGTSTTEYQDEHTPLKPDSVYGISKAAGIRCCQLYRRNERVFVSTGILFNHESPLRKMSFVSQKIVQGALRSRRDPAFRLILGDLNAGVDWGYAPDYVDAMCRILQLPEASDFVVASGEVHTVAEFAQIAFDEVGLDWRKHVETDTHLLNRRCYPLRGSYKKLHAATGWLPTLSFPELVRKLVQEAYKIHASI